MNPDKEITTQKNLFIEAVHLAKTPIIIALILTPIRFTLEYIGLSENIIFIIGLLWLTIGFSMYWGIKFHNKKRFLILLLLSLIVYSPISRFPVALAWWVDTNWQLGTHYGLYFDNFGQVLLNQVIYGSLVQILPGFLLGSITFAIMQYRQTFKPENNSIKNG